MDQLRRGSVVLFVGILVGATFATERGRAVVQVVRHAVARRSGGAAAPSERPLVALIIDDFGYVDTAIVNGFLSLPVPLTAAVLPYQLQSRFSAELAHQRGKEVIIHLPMQGHDGSNPGPDALMDSLSEKEMRDKTRSALADIPFIVGVNNHMGSVITAEPARMRWILEEVRAKSLYFVDSRTTPKTVAESLARVMKIPTASRQVFLDDSKAMADIEAEWAKAVRIAEHSGRVVVIGHVYPETLAALRTIVARDSNRVRFVTASALVR